MKRIVMLLFTAAAMATSAHACDVCGCAAGGQYLGLLPRANMNFIGFQYQYNGFTSAHPSLFENRPDDHSEDHYNTFQLWGRYGMGRHLQLFAFLPYKYNMQYGDTVNYRSSGIGDMSLLINAVVVNRSKARWQHQLLAGGGLKLPTGRYTGITEMDKLGLPNLQPGTGSWDFIVNTNYTVRNDKYGVNADMNYMLTTANAGHYKYGNRLGVSSLVFRSLRLGKIDAMPQAGLRYEYALHDYDNYQRKWLNEQSGGYMAFATIGAQGYYKKIGARVNYNIPFSQQYSSGFVTIKQRLDAAFFLLF